MTETAGPTSGDNPRSRTIVRRDGPGRYRVGTAHGTFQVEHHGSVWFITYPGKRDPDEWADTLKIAKLLISRWEARAHREDDRRARQDQERKDRQAEALQPEGA